MAQETVVLQVKKFPLKWRRKIASEASGQGKDMWEILVAILEKHFNENKCNCHAKKHN